MTDGLSLDRLKALVAQQFEMGAPNGWSLGWDLDRLFGVISAAVRPADCVNETSFDYRFCNKFEVTPATRSIWTLTLTVRVSFVAPFYSMHWTRYGPKTAGVVSAVPVDLADIAKRVRGVLIAQNFTELPDEWHDEPVPGVVLELAGASGVTLSKCLFEDYE